MNSGDPGEPCKQVDRAFPSGGTDDLRRYEMKSPVAVEGWSATAEARSAGEVGCCRSLADICEADHGFWKDQPLAVAHALGFVRLAE
jgi:hypothetical protein